MPNLGRSSEGDGLVTDAIDCMGPACVSRLMNADTDHADVQGADITTIICVSVRACVRIGVGSVPDDGSSKPVAAGAASMASTWDARWTLWLRVKLWGR